MAANRGGGEAARRDEIRRQVDSLRPNFTHAVNSLEDILKARKWCGSSRILSLAEGSHPLASRKTQFEIGPARLPFVFVHEIRHSGPAGVHQEFRFVSKHPEAEGMVKKIAAEFRKRLGVENVHVD